MVLKTNLKNLFKNGMIPTEDDYALFIDSFVAYVNGVTPNSNGDVETQFKIIDPLAPDVPPISYPVGASEFYSDYDPADYQAYIDANPSMAQLEEGQICVRTFRSNGFSYQQIDNVKDGLFNAAFVRLNVDANTWGVLSSVVSGSITPIDVIDNLFSDDEESALSARQGKILASMIEDVESNIVIVENSLDSTSETNALSAYMGKVVYDMNNFIMDELEDHVQEYASYGGLGHVRIDSDTVKMDADTKRIYVPVASTTQTGAVRVDNATINIDSDGVIRTADYVPLLTTFDLDALPSSYGNKTRTICTLYPVDHMPIINPIILDFTSFVWSRNSNSLSFITEKISNSNYIQYIDFNYYSVVNPTGTSFYRYARLYRCSQDLSIWHKWQMEFTTFSGKVNPNDNQIGIVGNKYLNTTTGEMWVKKGTSSDISYTGWTKLAPTVLNNAYSPVDDDLENIYSAFTVNEMFQSAKTNLKDDVKLNRIWDSRPITNGATTWTVDFSDEPDLTDLTKYDFEVYDDGVLVFNNAITHVVNNANKTVTFTPTTPMLRAFTITCIGRGLEFT